MAENGESDSWAASAEVVIEHPTGLHARPAITFTKLAKTFPAAEIRIRAEGATDWIDAKSIVKVMGSKLRSGTRLQLRASGEGAQAAIDALKGLVERNFDETAERP